MDQTLTNEKEQLITRNINCCLYSRRVIAYSLSTKNKKQPLCQSQQKKQVLVQPSMP